MKPNVLIGSAVAAVLMGIGILAGSVVGSGSVSAQTPSTTPTAVASSNAPTTPITPTKDLPGMRGGPGGKHGGGFGRDGFGGGPFGLGATSDGASQQITNVTNLITTAKADLAYANGKMDTADVQRWIAGAETLLKSAQSASSSSQYGQAVSYAEAARELLMTAESQMAQQLGAGTLPSASQRPQHPDRDIPADATLTQAQASYMLAQTYNRLVAEATQVEGASNAAEATPYLTEAQNAYKAAYDAYQAGNYTDAASSARLAGKLAHVASAIARASTAPANSDTPVTVPSPNF
ncbi:MAG TPA: hypothetical protein VJ183_03700 [Chloroflexia bacterium]|nr:hypothetical protein [Chloroflexia bacterium]